MNLSEPTQPLVSILIRVLNEERALRRLFECLRIQKFHRPFEVVVIDNESDDGSTRVASAMGARVFTLPRPLFGYGRALNIGIKLCRGDLVVLLSAHAWPQGNDWMSRMVNCVESQGVAAAYCRQLADGTASTQEKTRFKAFPEHNYTLDKDRLLQRCWCGEDVFDICCFSNAAAIVRREMVVRFPFRDLPFAEDRAFVLDCVMAGHSIAYLGTAFVTYQQTAIFKNPYRVGKASHISRLLIHELGSQTIGTDLRKSNRIQNVVRRLCRPLEIIGGPIAALLCDRTQLRRAAHYAVVSCVLLLGGIVGELTWYRYRKTTGCDSSMLLILEESIRVVGPENAIYTVT